MADFLLGWQTLSHLGKLAQTITCKFREEKLFFMLSACVTPNSLITKRFPSIPPYNELIDLDCIWFSACFATTIVVGIISDTPQRVWQISPCSMSGPKHKQLAPSEPNFRLCIWWTLVSLINRQAAFVVSINQAIFACFVIIVLP